MWGYLLSIERNEEAKARRDEEKEESSASQADGWLLRMRRSLASCRSPTRLVESAHDVLSGADVAQHFPNDFSFP
jgi:hypothetical protein